MKKPEGNDCIIYWDASAVLSILFRDKFSDDAAVFASRQGIHLISTLASAEVYAVIARMKRERILAPALLDSAVDALHSGPWRRLNLLPDWRVIKELHAKWPLRGADLWHLAAAKTLQKDLPELAVLTFDRRLRTACEGEALQCSTGK